MWYLYKEIWNPAFLSDVIRLDVIQLACLVGISTDFAQFIKVGESASNCLRTSSKSFLVRVIRREFFSITGHLRDFHALEEKPSAP
jgi:hypothetical protein